MPSSQLQAQGAFGGDKIYLAEDLLYPNSINPDRSVNVLLQEIGHYLDFQINQQDSVGDEGAIFAKLVRDRTFEPGELLSLQAEDDRVAMMLVPDGTIQDVFNNPSVDGSKRPLFSIADANPILKNIC